MRKGLTLTALIAAAVTYYSLPALAGEQEVRNALTGSLAGANRANIQPSGVNGIFEVELDGNFYYATEDGKYLFTGHLIDLKRSVDVTEERLSTKRKDLVDSIAQKDMIVFEPKNQPAKHTITVFTDIDCGYCRKLHNEMEGYLAQGIRVRYLFFPRSGPSTASWSKAEAVMCSADRNKAITDAKSLRPVSADACVNPVMAHYTLGQKLGVRGTPAIVTDSGELVPGYRPPAALAAQLAGS